MNPNHPSSPSSIDSELVQWGERLFYPPNRRVPNPPGGARGALSLQARAAAVRQRIQRVVSRAPQVMVKVSGGGRGMGAIAAHFRYISKNGRLPMEDDRGIQREGKDALRDVAEQWRLGGSRIPERSERREAFNIVLSMPRGTDPLVVRNAAREFAQTELREHRYVMALHDHQAHPHVHLCVRAESRHGKRLNPRKVDLQRWRETFAERLRGWGVEADSTRQMTRGDWRERPRLWETKVKGALQASVEAAAPGDPSTARQLKTLLPWTDIAQVLMRSTSSGDQKLARDVTQFIHQMPAAKRYLQMRQGRSKRQALHISQDPLLKLGDSGLER